MDDTVGRLQVLLPPDQFDLIIGSLLGDARLECRSRGERYPVSARMRIHQSEKQREYVFWKYSILKDIVLRGPRRTEVWYDKKRGMRHYSWYFHTKTLEQFGPLHRLFYRNAVKVFPEGIMRFLTPRALAVWFMDDGSNTGSAYTLNTHNFTLEEQWRILDSLRRIWSINATLVKDRAKYKISIGRREAQKFTDIVAPYMIPSMAYKICSPRND